MYTFEIYVRPLSTCQHQKWKILKKYHQFRSLSDRHRIRFIFEIWHFIVCETSVFFNLMLVRTSQLNKICTVAMWFRFVSLFIHQHHCSTHTHRSLCSRIHEHINKIPANDGNNSYTAIYCYSSSGIHIYGIQRDKYF